LSQFSIYAMPRKRPGYVVVVQFRLLDEIFLHRFYHCFFITNATVPHLMNLGRYKKIVARTAARTITKAIGGRVKYQNTQPKIPMSGTAAAA